MQNLKEQIDKSRMRYNLKAFMDKGSTATKKMIPKKKKVMREKKWNQTANLPTRQKIPS